MTNDAKLGMLVGVIGVVFAAVFITKQPEQPAAAEPQANVQPTAVPSVPASAPGAGTRATAAQPQARSADYPSTPVVRSRQQTSAHPVSLQANFDEEP